MTKAPKPTPTPTPPKPPKPVGGFSTWGTGVPTPPMNPSVSSIGTGITRGASAPYVNGALTGPQNLSSANLPKTTTLNPTGPQQSVGGFGIFGRSTRAPFTTYLGGAKETDEDAGYPAREQAWLSKHPEALHPGVPQKPGNLTADRHYARGVQDVSFTGSAGPGSDWTPLSATVTRPAVTDRDGNTTKAFTYRATGKAAQGVWDKYNRPVPGSPQAGYGVLDAKYDTRLYPAGMTADGRVDPNSKGSAVDGNKSIGTPFRPGQSTFYGRPQPTVLPSISNRQPQGVVQGPQFSFPTPAQARQHQGR